MSRKTRTINWMEGKIIEKLAKRQEIHTENIRSIEEEHNFDIALAILVSKKKLQKKKMIKE